MKYEIVEQSGIKRVVALKDFFCTGSSYHGAMVHKGQVGGIVSDDDILSQEGNCWIDEGSEVHGVRIEGDTYVTGSTITGSGCITGSSSVHSSVVNVYSISVEDSIISASLIKQDQYYGSSLLDSKIISSNVVVDRTIGLTDSDILESEINCNVLICCRRSTIVRSKIINTDELYMLSLSRVMNTSYDGIIGSGYTTSFRVGHDADFSNQTIVAPEACGFIVPDNSWVSIDDSTSKFPILFMELPEYNITITDNHIKIGCQHHSIDEWENMTGEEIYDMDGDTAVAFYDRYVKLACAMAKARPPFSNQ